MRASCRTRRGLSRFSGYHQVVGENGTVPLLLGLSARVIPGAILVAMLFVQAAPGQPPPGSDDARARWFRERYGRGEQGPQSGPMGPGFGGMGPGFGMPGAGFMGPRPGFGPPGSGFGPPGSGFGFPSSGFGPPGFPPRPPFQMPGPTSPGAPGATPPGARPTPANDPAAERRKEFEKHNATLVHLDSNRNGVIEPKELEGGQSHSHKKMFEEAAAKAGMPATVPAQVSQVRERLMAVLQIPSSGSPGQVGSGTGAMVLSFGVPAGATPLAGFGVAQTLPPVQGFGTGTGSPGSSVSSASSNADEQRAREFAQNLMRNYDKNKSGVLEKDEWGGLRGDPKEIDRNGDGVITLDEMTARVLSYRRDRERGGPPPPPSSPAGPPAAGTAASSKNPGKAGSTSNSTAPVQTWRFAASGAQLPEGLPEWFKGRDADGDGQVSMAEFASDWSEELIGQFLRYDANDDGIITPAECLAAKDAPPPPPRLESARRTESLQRLESPQRPESPPRESRSDRSRSSRRNGRGR